MPQRPDPIKGRRFMVILGFLGLIIVGLSIPVQNSHSPISVIGYLVGFVCVMLAAIALYDMRKK